MSDYPKEKLFRIYAGDVGSDAYKHQYVTWLQDRLAAAESLLSQVRFALHETQQRLAKAEAESSQDYERWMDQIKLNAYLVRRRDELRTKLWEARETNRNNVSNYQLQVQELQAKLATVEASLKCQHLLDVDSPLFEGLVGCGVGDGVLLATLAKLKGERNEARTAARWLYAERLTNWESDATLLTRWPWLKLED